MQHENKLAFVFCGAHKLEEMAADYWSIFFNTAMYLKINFLSEKDTIALIIEPVKNQLTYDDLAIQQILKLTHGQPYLTQLICRTLVNDLNENKKRNYANINDVDDAANYIINQGADHFSQHIWDDTSRLEHLILSAAARELTDKNLESIGLDSIYHKISGLVGKATKEQYIKALNRLVSIDVLSEKNTRYRFPVNLFRKWVYMKNPLDKVRGEMD